MKKVLILDNIRSVYNVGSMFRTSNALGIDEIYLCGITPTPLDKKGRERSDFAKVALGAEKKALWHYEENTVSIIKKLKEEGYLIIAIEQDKKSVDYKSVDISKYDKVAFLVGPEVTGIDKNVLNECDVIAEISMLGEKESLNVTIAMGVALYRILNI